MTWTPAEADRVLKKKRPIGADPGPPSRLRRGAGKRPKAAGATTAKPAKGLGYDPFVLLLEAAGLPAPLLEFVFLPGRRFRADYAWLEPRKLIVEREGGLFDKGRAGMAHAMPTAIIRDMRRSNLAQLAGFLYLRYLPAELDTGTCLPELRILLGKVV